MDKMNFNKMGADKTPTYELMKKPTAGMLSFEFIAAPVMLTLIGLWLDRAVFHTEPWLTVSFAIIGVIGATIKLFFGYKDYMISAKESRPGSKPSQKVGR
jgi:F0F1-type ATP synthase assembly protein I